MANERVRFQILVIEDDIPFRDFLASALMELGHEVLMVAHYKQALNLARKIPFDLMIVDGILPDGNGVLFIEQAKKINPKALYIFLSAREEFFTDPVMVKKLREGLCVDKCHKKPIDSATLLMEINALLSTHQKVDGFAAIDLLEVLEEEPDATLLSPQHPPTSDASFYGEAPTAPSSSTPSLVELQAWLGQKRGSYAKKIEGALVELAELVRGAAEWTPESPALARAYTLAHNLHGSAGVYGFGKVGAHCARIERILQDYQEGKPVTALVQKATMSIKAAQEALRNARTD